jgi:hypothetical protein
MTCRCVRARCVVRLVAAMSPPDLMDTARNVRRPAAMRLSIEGGARRRIRSTSRRDGGRSPGGTGSSTRSAGNVPGQPSWSITSSRSAWVARGLIRTTVNHSVLVAITVKPASSDPPREGGSNLPTPQPDNRLAVFLRWWRNWGGGYLVGMKEKDWFLSRE